MEEGGGRGEEERGEEEIEGFAANTISGSQPQKVIETEIACSSIIHIFF